MIEGMPDRLTVAERRIELDRAVSSHVRRHAVVLHQSDAEALLTYPGKSINNVLHAILSIFTFGMWLFVWALVAIYCAVNGEKQFTVWVDEYGATYSDLNANEPSVVKTWAVIGGILLVLIILMSV